MRAGRRCASKMSDADAPITILVCALGGEGGGVLAEWLARRPPCAGGHSAQSTSIPGVAQRTGRDDVLRRGFPASRTRALGGRQPVLQPQPGAGRDRPALLSSGLLETVRQIGSWHATARGATASSASSSRALTTAEKMQLGDGRDGDRRRCRDAGAPTAPRGAACSTWRELAREAGTVISAVLFGAIAASGVLPFARACVCEEHDPRSPTGRLPRAPARLRGGVRIVLGHARRARRNRCRRGGGESAWIAGRQAMPTSHRVRAARAPRLADRARSRADVRDLVARPRASASTTTDRRLRRPLRWSASAASLRRRAGRRSGRRADTATRCDARPPRWLALWSGLRRRRAGRRTCRARASSASHASRAVKGRTRRWRLVGVRPLQARRAEFAALLPQVRLPGALVRWDAGRRNGPRRDAFALPLKMPARTRVPARLPLRSLAAPEGPAHRRATRFARRAVASITALVDTAVQGAREHWLAGRELAECGRLIKGYGATNERAARRTCCIVRSHLRAARRFASAPQRAAAIRAARTRRWPTAPGHALDSDAGSRHGAPARPVHEQPIRWCGSRPGALRQMHRA